MHSIFCYAAQPKTPKIIKPSFIPSSDKSLSNQDITTKKKFAHSTVQFAYFTQELTNFIDAHPSNYFYDYINPNIPEQAFLSNSFNIYKKILLLKNIEKSPKERAAAEGIARFLAINYKTHPIPAYAYVNNPQLPEPLYLSQLETAAFKSIKTGRRDVLHSLVNNYDLLSAKDRFGNGLLANAILFKRNNMVKFLISKNANVNASNKDGVTPIIVAVRTKNFEAANFLIKKGCNIRKTDSMGNSALDYARADNNTEMYLLLKNALKKPRIKSRRMRRSKRRFK